LKSAPQEADRMIRIENETRTRVFEAAGANVD